MMGATSQGTRPVAMPVAAMSGVDSGLIGAALAAGGVS